MSARSVSNRRGKAISRLVLVLMLGSAVFVWWSISSNPPSGKQRSIWESQQVRRAHQAVLTAQSERNRAEQTDLYADQMMQQTHPYFADSRNPVSGSQIVAAIYRLDRALSDLDFALKWAFGPSLFAPRKARLEFQAERLQGRIEVLNSRLRLTDDMLSADVMTGEPTNDTIALAQKVAVSRAKLAHELESVEKRLRGYREPAETSEGAESN